MTEGELKDSGGRILDVFSKMFNAVALVHHAAEEAASDAAREKVSTAILLTLLSEVVKIYPKGQLARQDLRAIADRFGVKLTLVDLDLPQARKARDN